MSATMPISGDPIRLNTGDIREDGPGGGLVLVRRIDFDPRDVHEMQPVDCYLVYDDITGALLLDTCPFGLWKSGAHFADDGRLTIMIGDLRLIIDPSAQTWAMDHDGWRLHPLDGDQAKIDALVRPALTALHPPPAQTMMGKAKSAWMNARFWAELLLFTAAIAVAAWLLAVYGWRPYSRPNPTARTAVNAWLVTCPELQGLMVFSINPDGTLSAPPEISPVRLSPIDGGDKRFGFGDLVIAFKGRDVMIERDGQTITCAPPVPR